MMNLCLELLCSLMMGFSILGIMLLVLWIIMVLLISMFLCLIFEVLCRVVCFIVDLVIFIGVMNVNGVICLVWLMFIWMLSSLVCVFLGGYL